MSLFGFEKELIPVYIAGAVFFITTCLSGYALLGVFIGQIAGVGSSFAMEKFKK